MLPQTDNQIRNKKELRINWAFR